MKRKWTKTKHVSIEAAWKEAKLWEENPTDISKKEIVGSPSYLQQFSTPDGTRIIQKFNVLYNMPVSAVYESEDSKPQGRIRRKGKTNKKPDKVYSVPQPPLEEFLPGPERKVTQWRYEQTRQSMDEIREYYATKFKPGFCEIHEVLLIRYRSCGQEFEFFKTLEGHIVSRTLYDPIQFPE